MLFFWSFLAGILWDSRMHSLDLKISQQWCPWLLTLHKFYFFLHFRTLLIFMFLLNLFQTSIAICSLNLRIFSSSAHLSSYRCVMQLFLQFTDSVLSSYYYPGEAFKWVILFCLPSCSEMLLLVWSLFSYSLASYWLFIQFVPCFLLSSLYILPISSLKSLSERLRSSCYLLDPQN